MLTIRWMRYASEAVILTMACLSPWAIGSVDAWAQLILYGGLTLLAVLSLATGQGPDFRRSLFCAPSLALVGLALLACAQAVALPEAVEKVIAPSTHAWRSELAPRTPQSVKGVSGSAVVPPSNTLSHDPEASVRMAAQVAAAWLLFQYVMGLGRGTSSLRIFGLATVANASLMTLFSIAQAMSWNGKIYGIREVSPRSGWLTGGPFVCHNHLAAYLNLAFGLALGFFLATIQNPSRSRGKRPTRSVRRSLTLLAGYAAGLIFAGVVISHSRGGLLSIMIATAVTMFLLRPTTVRIGASLGILAIVTCLFLGVTGTASPFQRLAALADTSQPEHEGVSSRLQIWGVAFQVWRTFPIWGTGLGSFPASTAAFLQNRGGSEYFSHAESEYMQILAEGGIVGLALCMVALVMTARLAFRARDFALDLNDRALVLGSMAGGLALFIQCLSDFPLHIPGVAITAVILAAHLCRLGLEATEVNPPADTRLSRAAFLLSRVAMLGLSVGIFVFGLQLYRAEALVRAAGLPYPGSLMPTVDSARWTDAELNQRRHALEAALRTRPNWAEGHLRLGTTMLSLYSNLAASWIGEFEEEKSPKATAILSDPMWLHGVIHSASANELEAMGGVLDHEPIRDYLVPAARCFLEARRCSPDLALSHARLAELDYLVIPGESTTTHVTRACRLTGYDYALVIRAGQAASQTGDIDLAARCWQRVLSIHVHYWPEVTVTASIVMPPEQILDKVLPPGARLRLLVADRLYSTPEFRETREKFLRACIAQLSNDATLNSVERTWLEGQARARLDERERARTLMMDALDAQPLHPERRVELIDFLITWGEVDEASRQARIGLNLHPENPLIQRAVKSAQDAFTQAKASVQSRE